jgi:hypothetical protein
MGYKWNWNGVMFVDSPSERKVVDQAEAEERLAERDDLLKKSSDAMSEGLSIIFRLVRQNARLNQFADELNKGWFHLSLLLQVAAMAMGIVVGIAIGVTI